MIAAPWGRLNIPRREVTEFLGVFARFEFALKLAGLGGNPGDDAQPNWDMFAARVGPLFNRAATPALTAAVDYLIQAPPKKQVVDAHGHLTFIETPTQGGTEFQQVMLSVRRVRNNLFHGAKFEPGVDP